MTASVSAWFPAPARKRKVAPSRAIPRKTYTRPIISVPTAQPAWTLARPPVATVYPGTDYRVGLVPGGGLTAVPAPTYSAVPLPKSVPTYPGTVIPKTTYSGTVPGLAYQSGIVAGGGAGPGDLVPIDVPDGLLTAPPEVGFKWYDTPMGKVGIVVGVLAAGGIAWMLLK